MEPVVFLLNMVLFRPALEIRKDVDVYQVILH